MCGGARAAAVAVTATQARRLEDSAIERRSRCEPVTLAGSQGTHPARQSDRLLPSTRASLVLSRCEELEWIPD